jgi:hypothetical protein
MSAPKRHGKVGMIPAQLKVMRLDRPVCKTMPLPLAANPVTIWSDNDHVWKRRFENDQGKRGQVG